MGLIGPRKEPVVHGFPYGGRTQLDPISVKWAPSSTAIGIASGFPWLLKVPVIAVAGAALRGRGHVNRLPRGAGVQPVASSSNPQEDGF